MDITNLDIQTLSQAVIAVVAAGFAFARSVAALFRLFKKS